MSTRKQRAASRANAQKSTGPRTEAGKAASSCNALKHGIDARQQVMFNESAEDLAQLAAEYHQLHSPANAEERFLVDTLVNNEWRLRRLRRVEAELWLTARNQSQAENPDGAAALTAADAFAHSGPVFERLQRIVNSCQRNFNRASQELAAIAQAKLEAQAEQSTTTSASSASFHNQPPAPPQKPPYVPPYTPAEMKERAQKLWEKLVAEEKQRMAAQKV
jgi:hypothetical protein